MCTPDHRQLAGEAPATKAIPKKPKEAPRAIGGNVQKAIEVDVAPVEEVATKSMEQQLFEAEVSKVRAQLAEFSVANKVYLNDDALNASLNLTKDNLAVSIEPGDREFLDDAIVNLKRAETRLAVLKAAKTPAPVAKALSTGVDAERLARIAKERAIKSTLNGVVATAQANSRKDFETVVKPWRNNLTIRLAAACGISSAVDMNNAHARRALLNKIKEEIISTIGQKEAERLLPYFILNA